MLVDLLRVSTRGVNPMKLTCFEPQEAAAQDSSCEALKTVHKDTAIGLVDPASLAGGIKLKDWNSRYEVVMGEAMEMLRLDLYGLDRIRPIGALCKVFEW